MFCKSSSIVGFVGEIWSMWTILIWRQFYLINNVISSSSSSLNLVIRKEDVILENNAFPWVASTVYIDGKHLKIIMTFTHNFNYCYFPHHDTLKTCLITVSFAWPSGKIISHEHALPKNLAFKPPPPPFWKFHCPTPRGGMDIFWNYTFPVVESRFLVSAGTWIMDSNH